VHGRGRDGWLRSGFANRGMGGIERDVLLREGWVANTGMGC
jgi:hypothetical protein